MGRYTHLTEIRRLDPGRDYHRIYRLTALYEFPWDVRTALNLAFYRTFALPSISELLVSTGEMTERTQKRADDTGLLMFELIEHGLDHPRGRAAVRRLNQIHRRFPIAADDYRYVLGTFVFVPDRWLRRYGWRPLCCHERAAAFVFYRELGARMGIKDIPASYPEFEAFFDATERARFSRTSASEELMRTTKRLLLAQLPAPLAPLGGIIADGLLDEPLRRAVGADPVPPPARLLLHAALRARAHIVRLLPARKVSVFADGMPTFTYPNGYTIAELGPPT